MFTPFRPAPSTIPFPSRNGRPKLVSGYSPRPLRLVRLVGHQDRSTFLFCAYICRCSSSESRCRFAVVQDCRGLVRRRNKAWACNTARRLWGHKPWHLGSPPGKLVHHRCASPAQEAAEIGNALPSFLHELSPFRQPRRRGKNLNIPQPFSQPR